MAGMVGLTFIHHSCGGQLLADAGPEVSRARCIHPTHPNGGGLRRRLEAAGFAVHEASYGSQIGDKTDLFDWLPKFRGSLDRILRIDENDRLRDEGHNRIVVFKSCYTENELLADGQSPGNAVGPELTLWNAKATLSALRAELAQRPDVLFVYLTSPPLAPRVPREPVWKLAAKTLLGRPRSPEVAAERAARARVLATWAKSPDGLAGAGNVAVFDYYDVLTDGGASNLSCYPTGGGFDSHPSSAGNQRAAEAFVPFLEAAARAAGIT